MITSMRYFRRLALPIFLILLLSLPSYAAETFKTKYNPFGKHLQYVHNNFSVVTSDSVVVNTVTADVIVVDNITIDTLCLDGASGNVYLSPERATSDAYYRFPVADGTSGQHLTTNGAGVWYWATSAGAGDITSIGDVINGAAFDGTQGTTLTFFNAGGNATQVYNGTLFTFSKPVVATSYAIGANTLDTNEWANLDGQDQAVKTTSSPSFAKVTTAGIGDFGLIQTDAVLITTAVTQDAQVLYNSYGVISSDSPLTYSYTNGLRTTFMYENNAEVAGPVRHTEIRHISASFDPDAVCDGAVDRVFLMTVGDDSPSGIIIDEWKLSFEADPTTEVDLDLKRADAFIGVANSAVMDVLDTTAGVSSEDTDANINGGAAVTNGKVIYLEFGTAYTETTHQINFQMFFHNN